MQSSQAQINTLKEITNKVQTIHEVATVGSFTGGVAGAVGGIAAVAGFALAPFTFGASLVVAQIGTAAAVAGGVTSAASNITNLIYQKVSRDDIEKALKTFKTKLSPITNRLEDIELNMKELPLLATSGVLFAASGLQLFDLIDDIAVMAAAQVSKSLKLAAALSGILAGVTVALDIFFVVNDAKELKRIKEGKAGSSETLKFIEKMKETIKNLQQIVDIKQH
uniref:Uncharacterized protein n=1 Tax=Astyanax mexicanus TaxID=7994 RepID=A0A3B1JTC3_ASTMX